MPAAPLTLFPLPPSSPAGESVDRAKHGTSETLTVRPAGRGLARRQAACGSSWLFCPRLLPPQEAKHRADEATRPGASATR